jgi:hypothetical protein
MFVCKGNVVYDYDLNMLVDVLEVIDQQLAKVGDGWEDQELADQFGVFNRAEHIVGLGFVACQAYLTATYGFLKVDKCKALDLGPVYQTGHGGGQRIVRIVNDAANFWKHHDEWHRDESSARQQKIRESFTAMGFPDDPEYPLSGILSKLAAPEVTAFKPLAAGLTVWRDDLRKTANAHRGSVHDSSCEISPRRL